jgi:hypothetical protein
LNIILTKINVSIPPEIRFVLKRGPKKEVAMKRFVLFLILPVLAGCGPYQQIADTTGKSSHILNISKDNQDQDQYDIVIIDPGFDNWFETTWNPAVDHPEKYYDLWNDQYVAAWNYKATQMGSSDVFDSVINYDPGTDYGMKVSRTLYYYFRYVEIVKKTQILDYKRRDGVI